MKALIVADAHLFRTPDGKVWTKTIYGNEFWQRYLNVFDSIDIAARLSNVSYDEIEGFLRVDGRDIKFKPMPMARGGKEYIKKLIPIVRSAKNAVEDEACAIIRFPSMIATFIYPFILKNNVPHGIEVVADPSEVYKTPIIRKVLSENLKRAALKANGVAYVTKFALQSRYPSYSQKYGSDEVHFEEHYSSITLPEEAIGKPKSFKGKTKFILAHTSNSINNDMKGHSVVISAVKYLREKGYDIEARFIGDGTMRPEFEKMAMNLGVGEYIHFVGWIPSGKEVRAVLDDADIFILPSESEGLPRAVIEAMAAGLPCVASRVGGIPELLQTNYLCDPKDVQGYCDVVEHFILDTNLMEQESRRNIEKARDYTVRVLQERRDSFYSKIKALTKQEL